MSLNILHVFRRLNIISLGFVTEFDDSIKSDKKMVRQLSKSAF